MYKKRTCALPTPQNQLGNRTPRRFSGTAGASPSRVLREYDSDRGQETGGQEAEPMIVSPFRSKFLPAEVVANSGDRMVPLTFVMDDGVSKRYGEWLPALADLFLEHYPLRVLDAVPETMKEWKESVSEENASSTAGVVEWLHECVEVTGNQADYVTIGQLRDMYGGAPRSFARAVKACFESIAEASVYDHPTNVRIDGAWVTKRGVVRGVRLRESV